MTWQQQARQRKRPASLISGPFFEKLGGQKPATFATLEGNPVPMCALLV